MAELPELLQRLNAARERGDSLDLDSAQGALVRELRARLPQDPLLAASCLAAVEDPALRDLLAPLAAEAEPRVGRASALLVEDSGRGRVSELLVELVPGNGEVWTPQPLAPDAHMAAQLGVAVALGPEARRWSVRWQLRDTEAIQLRGSSLGLPVALATLSARRGLPLPADLASTGAVELDGRVRPVTGLPAKLRAAREAGLSRVVLPAAELAALPSAEGLELLPAEQVGAVWEALHPTPLRRRWPSARPLILLLPPLLAFLGATDALEAPLRAPAAAAISGIVPAEHSAILALPEGDLRQLRGSHPDTIDRLVEAGASAIAFDLLLLSESAVDGEIAEAVERAERAGVGVVLAGRWDQESLQGPATPALAEAARVAVIDFEEDLLFGKVRRAPVRLTEPGGRSWWHLGVEAAAAHLDARPQLEDGVLEIGVTRNATRAERLHLPQVAPSPRLDWADAAGWEQVKGRVVLVGVLDGRQDRYTAPWGPVYGVELHAALVETLLRQRALRLGRPSVDAAFALLAGLLTWAVARRSRALALVPGGALLVVLGALAATGTLHALVPVLLGLVLGQWAVSRG